MMELTYLWVLMAVAFLIGGYCLILGSVELRKLDKVRTPPYMEPAVASIIVGSSNLVFGYGVLLHIVGSTAVGMSLVLLSLVSSMWLAIKKVI